MKRNIIALLVLALFLIFVGCNSRTTLTEEEMAVLEIQWNMVEYAAIMGFDNSAVPPDRNSRFYSLFFLFFLEKSRGIPIDEEYYAYLRGHTEIAFVHNETEAVGFPDHVLVAWPGEAALGVVDRLNQAVNRDESEIALFQGRDRARDIINLEDFGLTSPIVVADLVDNWEQIRALFLAFMPHERSGISV